MSICSLLFSFGLHVSRQIKLNFLATNGHLVACYALFLQHLQQQQQQQQERSESAIWVRFHPQHTSAIYSVKRFR